MRYTLTVSVTISNWQICIMYLGVGGGQKGYSVLILLSPFRRRKSCTDMTGIVHLTTDVPILALIHLGTVESKKDHRVTHITLGALIICTAVRSCANPIVWLKDTYVAKVARIANKQIAVHM